MTYLSVVISSTAALILLLCRPAFALSAPEGPTPTEIEVSFRLDPGITRGMYMGERWVSPPVFSAVGKGDDLAVKARVSAIGDGGRSKLVSADWEAAEGGQVFLSAGEGGEMEISARCGADSLVRVTAKGDTAELLVRAVCKNGAITVEISK